MEPVGQTRGQAGKSKCRPFFMPLKTTMRRRRRQGDQNKQKAETGGSRAKRGGQHRVETEGRGARVEKAGREEERRQCEAQDEQRRHEVAGQAEAEARRAGQT